MMGKFTFYPYKVKEVYIMKKIYTEEQRNKILQRYRSWEKVASVCQDAGIAKSIIYEWTRSANKKLSTCRTFENYGSVAKY